MCIRDRSSIAYGPEQVILVLVSLSPLAIWWSLPIGIFVLLLLASLTISYRQIIHAYPQGGGAYMVTRENLSPELDVYKRQANTYKLCKTKTS